MVNTGGEIITDAMSHWNIWSMQLLDLKFYIHADCTIFLSIALDPTAAKVAPNAQQTNNPENFNELEGCRRFSLS